MLRLGIEHSLAMLKRRAIEREEHSHEEPEEHNLNEREEHSHEEHNLNEREGHSHEVEERPEHGVEVPKFATINPLRLFLPGAIMRSLATTAIQTENSSVWIKNHDRAMDIVRSTVFAPKK